jgi:drug/metabolite transporter (DMT)-like permease
MNGKKDGILTNRAAVCLLAVLCCALWGSAFPGIKTGYRLFGIAASDAPTQILFAGLRFFLAGVLTIFIGSLIRRAPLLPHRGSWKRILPLMLFQTVAQYVLFYIGLAHASGVKSSVIEGAGVFITILLACLVFRQEKLTVLKVVGCVLGFSGIVLINLGGAGWGLSMSFLGEGFVLLSAVSSAISSSLIKIFAKEDDPVMLSGYQFACGGLVMAAAGFISGGRLSGGGAQGAAVLIYLAMLSAVAYTLWSVLLKYNPVSRVAVWGFTNPMFGVLLSMVFLSEPQQTPPAQLAAALLLVCLGIYTVNINFHARSENIRKM